MESIIRLISGHRGFRLRLGPLLFENLHLYVDEYVGREKRVLSLWARNTVRGLQGENKKLD